MAGTVVHVGGDEAGSIEGVGPVSAVPGPDEAVEALDDGVHCVVVEADSLADRGLAAVERVRAADATVPVVLCSEAPDGSLAAEATRRGATEYFAREGEGPSLAERVRSYLPASAPAAGTGDSTAGEPAAAGAATDAGTAAAPRGGGPGEIAALLDTAESLLGTRSPERVADIVVETAQRVLSMDYVTVRLYDAETGTLRPVASTLDVDRVLGERPDYAVGEGGPGRAYERGEVLRAADLPPGERPPDEMAAGVYLPLGEHGVLSLGTRSADRLDESVVSLVEVLASNAAVALSRIERERELLRYQTVLENVQDMVYVLDEDAEFSLVTEPLADWLGYDRSDLVGEEPGMVLGDDQQDAFESMIADMWHSDAFDQSRGLETEFCTASGERLPAEVEVSLIPAAEEFSGTVGVVRDLTELVEARERLQSERDRFSYLFNNLPDAVVETDFDEQTRPIVEAVNPAFVEVFGYDPEQVRGESLNEFVLPEGERETGRSLDREAIEGGTTTREVRRKTASGYRDFLFRGVPYESGEGVRGFGIYTDITEQKERERRLQVLNRVLRHNLRNDLNVIMGHAEMLARDLDDEDAVRRAHLLREKAEAVVGLGERARTLERTIDHESARDGTVDLQPLVAMAVGEFREAYPDATVRFAEDTLDVPVVGDERIKLAVGNVLENAAEHTDGPVTVRVAGREAGDMVELAVHDDGPGIPEHERAVVTESSEITQLTHGTGLGLWVVKWACESCGGRVRFEESPLGGAGVVLRFGRA